MAQAAKEMRTSAYIELQEAIRQAKRYLGSHQPSIRIIHQRIKRIRDKEEDFKRYHFAYQEKSGEGVESPDGMKELQDTLDASMDAIDDCTMFIDSIEEEKRREDGAAATASQSEEEDRVTNALYQKQLTEVSIDERIARDLCRNIHDLVTANELNSVNSAHMKSHMDALDDLQGALNPSWKALLDLPINAATRSHLAADILTLKSAIQAASSSGVVFLQQCQQAIHQTPPAPSSTNTLNTATVTLSNVKSSLDKIKPEKMSYPTFSGNIRTFARFKKDFTKIVVPFYSDEFQRAYVLKESCLKGKAKTLVENIDAIEDIWDRLEAKYGEKLDLVDSVITELNDVKPLKHNDDQRFVELVDKLEKGLLDLEAIGAREEVANMYTIKTIEKKLSRDQYKDWLKAEAKMEESGDPGRFEKLLKFLLEERRRVEKLVRRTEDSTREPTPKDPGKKVQGGSYAAQHSNGTLQDDHQRKEQTKKKQCLVHSNGNHFTRKCRTFLGKTPKERAEIVKNANACSLCLGTSHIGNPCPWKDKWDTCKIDQCGKYHSHLLHEAETQGFICSFASRTRLSNSAAGEVLQLSTLLQVQRIPTARGDASTFFDLGSTISLVARSYVIRNRLRGIPISYDLVTVGGELKPQTTYLHEISLKDRTGEFHRVLAFQIDDVCGKIQKVDVSAVAGLFPGLSAEDVQRPSGAIELLIGMSHAKIHPTRIDTSANLVLYESIFGSGRVLGGCHEALSTKDQIGAFAQIVAHAQIINTRVLSNACQCKDRGIDFFSIEDMGVKLPPRCPQCKTCKTCTTDLHQISVKDQREGAIISENLKLDTEKRLWTTPYPFLENPSVLENNESQADDILIKQERRFRGEEMDIKKYNEQFDDCVNRGVFRELGEQELANYKGPVFHVTHHAVYKEGSSSTPLRLVLNSSLKFKGRSLNDILMKGPNVLNNILGVQLRFRSYQVAVVCDLKKMYHTIKTTPVETHLRRLKFRHFDETQPIKTYGIETVSFGDRPAAAIASTAVRKTAEMFKGINPNASKKIIEDSYVDDITTGEDTDEEADALIEGIRDILIRGGFEVKGFVKSGNVSDEELELLGTGDMGRVLGIWYDPRKDIFKVRVRVNLSKKKKGKRVEEDLTLETIPSIIKLKVTKNMLLSITMSCYDVFGGLAPITIVLKISLRRLNNLGWDVEVSEETKQEWVKILTKLKEAEVVTFKRCVKPANALGQPILIICTDGSDLAMCATAHVRWECDDGTVDCRLWLARTRVAPIKKLTTPRIELQAALMGVRLSKMIQKNAVWGFDNIYHITDSKCLLGTISKETVALGEFPGNRVTEMLETTTPDQYYHVNSENNIADLATRENATIEDIKEESDWQIGSPWMRLPVSEWPVNQDTGRCTVPDEFIIKGRISASVITSPTQEFSYERFRGRSFYFARNVTAWLLRIFKARSMKDLKLTVKDLEDAEVFMLKVSMRATKVMLDKGQLRSLRAQVTQGGLIVLGGRAMEGMRTYYEQDEYPILTHKDPIAHLWIKKVHEEEHSGITKTVAKSRRRFWIVRARSVAAKVKHSCYHCRILDKELAKQKMAPLPTSRQTMSPTFYKVSLDLFGWFEIKDTVKKRTTRKVWGVVINCMSTRALYIDTTEDYGMESVLQVLRRFIALRGSPSSIFSDKGSQLGAAAEDLKAWAVAKKIDWDTAPSEGQHQNGASEALIKSVKRSLIQTIGQSILTFAELQTVFFEVADVINSRPIGIVSGSDPMQPAPITPNHLILGRATSQAVQGSLYSTKDVNKRFRFLQSLVDDWWKRWYQSVLPSLVPSYKWYQRHRNVKVGDVCLIKYKNPLKAQYKLGRVTRVKNGVDGLVRTVTLAYRNVNEKVHREVDRPIHGLAVIVPIEEQCVSSQFNPNAKEFSPSVQI